MSSSQLETDRKRLIARLKNSGFLKSAAVERAMRTVPREEFIRPDLRNQAYTDTPLENLNGQTVSAPHMCVIMCEALCLTEGLHILEVGAGSGYHAALCAEMVAPAGSSNPGHVYTIEIVPTLADLAQTNLKRTGYGDRVTVIAGDGGKGLPDKAPFDRIYVTTAAPSIPPPLTEQLKPEGIMVIPVGTPNFLQQLVIVEKNQDSQVRCKNWGGVAFVPMTGEYGQ